MDEEVLHISTPRHRAPEDVRTLVDLLRGRAEVTPSRVVYGFLADGETEAGVLTFGDLDRQARAIAASLRAADLTGGRALLVYPPSLEYVAAFFGCLYAGIVAVPAYPPDPLRLERTLPRLEAIVRDAQTAAVLTTGELAAMAGSLFATAPALATLRIVATDIIPAAGADAWRPPPDNPQALAFLQYTSGTTGDPRGVMLSHENVLHNLQLLGAIFEATPDSVCVSWLPPYHDMGLVGCILEPLYCGGRSWLMSPIAFLQQPQRWLRAISRYRGTICGGPNFAYELCVRRTTLEERARFDLACWKFAVCGAEPVRDDTMRRFIDAFGAYGFTPAAFHPCYGLAEATLIVAGDRTRGHPAPVVWVDRAGLERGQIVTVGEGAGRALVGCGRALGDQLVAVVDPDSGRRCGSDEVGELWVHGRSVAGGYWNRPQETTDTFRARLVPTGEGPFLRTGDLGFVRDGELFVTDRLKDQLVVRGVKHSADDIERTAGASHPALRAGGGAVFAVETADGEGIVVAHEIDLRQPLDPAEVFAAIRRAVAESHQVALREIVLIRPGAMPKTSSGKVQRRAARAAYLAGIDGVIARSEVTVGDRHTVRPDGEATARWIAAELAARVGFEVAAINPREPITCYGIDSLGAVALAHRIEMRFGVVCPPARLLDGTSVTGLSMFVGSSAVARDEAPPAGWDLEVAPGDYAPSRGQQAQWLLQTLAPHGTAYHLAYAVRLRRLLDVEALRAALRGLVARHAALRTTFPARDGRPVRRVHATGATDPAVEDVRALAPDAVTSRLEAAAYQPFDLATGPLLRVHAFVGHPTGDVVLLAVNHIVVDLWSIAVLVEELAQQYTAASRGTPLEIETAPVQPGDFVRWQTALLTGPEATRLRSYWMGRLQPEPPPLRLPTAPRTGHASQRAGTLTTRVGAVLTGALRALARAHHATAFETWLAAFFVLLARYSGQTDITVGAPVSGRTRSRFRLLIDHLVNMVALRVDLDGDLTFATALARVRTTVLGALAHQDYPFSCVVEAVNPVRDPTRHPLFQVVFAWQQPPDDADAIFGAYALGVSGAPLQIGALEGELIALEPRELPFDLIVSAGEVGDGVALCWQYRTDLFAARTIERLAENFTTLLAGIAEAPDVPISQLLITSPQERAQLLEAWNATRVAYPPTCLHELIARQVAEKPDTVAVVAGHQRWTYRELDRRANSVAHQLHGVGAGPETLVGICTRRGPEMVAGLLGILKAGAAYVALDPAFPPARLAFLFGDAHPVACLVQPGLEDILPKTATPIVPLAWPDAALPEKPPTVDVEPTNLAYVIYTSGSTGEPKAVALEHRNVSNLVHWARDAFEPADLAGTLAAAAISWDAAVFELFAPLAWGGTVYLIENGLDVVRLPLDYAVRLVVMVPSVMAEVLRWGRLPAGIRTIMLVGEAFRSALVDEVHASSGGARILNGYAPAETTTFSICGPLAAGDPDPPPLGRPIANTTLYVLDAASEPVPIGVPGELYIGGSGVARGYRGRDELTAARFVPDRFAGGGARLYRTGDLVRYRDDGRLEFVGRLDEQLKVRGYRIEPGEIEAALRRHSGVRDAVVAGQDGPGGGKRLAAYIVPAVPAPSAAELRSFLRQQLPAYLVPHMFMFLQQLPLNRNGKVDRRSLPPPDAAVPVAAPETDHIVNAVIAAWARVLGSAPRTTAEDFFDLGGDSLRAAEAAAVLGTALGLDLPIDFVLKHRTVGASARAATAALAAVAVRPCGETRAALLVPEAPWVAVEHRSLLSLITAGKLPPVDAAAIAYLPATLLQHAGIRADDVIDGWFEGLAQVFAVAETSLGRIATILLPRFDVQLYRDASELLALLDEAVQVASCIGAQVVSLTGLLPSATDYGAALVRYLGDRIEPRISNGHGTTIAAVGLSIEAALAAAGRPMCRERVGVLGLGSIGRGTLELVLRCMSAPAALILCDVHRQRESLDAIAGRVRMLGFQGPVHVVTSAGPVPDDFYDATLIVGATNAATILDVNRVRPGTVIVDDSAPHCFDPAVARRRMESAADFLVTEGGMIRTLDTIRQRQYVPRAVARLVADIPAAPWRLRDARQITGCVYSSLLSVRFPELPPTIGHVDVDTVLAHREALGRLGCTAAPLHCEDWEIPATLVSAFRDRFAE